MSATKLGVSLENVVATIDNPANHHGTDLADKKNSDVSLPARFPKNNAGANEISSVIDAMIQSIR
jgi:hypothetical protein